MFYGTLNKRQCSESFQTLRPPVKLLNFEFHLVAFPCSALIKNRTLWKSIEKYQTFKNPRYKFSIELEHFDCIKMKEFTKHNKSLFVRFVLKGSRKSGSGAVRCLFSCLPRIAAFWIASDCFLACEGKTFIWWWGHWDEVKALEVLGCTL